MTTPNAELAYRVLDHIDAHPDKWDQSAWKCGSSYCFGGWAVVLSGATVDYDKDELVVVAGPNGLVDLDVEFAARAVLGINVQRAWVKDFHGSPEDGYDDGWLFSAGNSREDLDGLVEAIFGPRPGGPS